MKAKRPFFSFSSKENLSLDKGIFFLFILLSFCIPFYKKVTPLIIVALAVLSLLRVIIIKQNKLQRFTLLSGSSIILYLLFVAGLLYTDQMDKGLFDLQVKLGFLIFPIIFFLSGSILLVENRYWKVLAAFVAGAFASTFLCIGHATYISLTTNFTFDHFIYAELSFLLHPSYYAMYLNLAIVICILYLEKNWSTISRPQKTTITVLILYLTVFILFVNSKAGIIITLITFLIVFIRLMVVKRKFILGSALLIVLFSSVAIVWTKVPYVKSRFQGFMISVSSYDKNIKDSREGTSGRILVWKNAFVVALEQLPLGAGTGDVNAVLKESYEKNSFTEGSKRAFNAHNQYLQTTIAIGIPGLLCLLLILGTLFHRGLQSGKRLVFYFALIIALNFLVESMLETQAGTVFTAFFISFFAMKENLPEKKQNRAGNNFTEQDGVDRKDWGSFHSFHRNARC